ncbi:MAG: cytochrome c maturation protein CcmE [Chloroflexi bacterium]|nr:cytochrome c maturation protein CcmE [Chloroflexota bacterium]
MRNITRFPNPFPRLNRFLIGGAIVAAAILFLITSALQTSGVYYLEVDELLAKGPAAYDQAVRLNGVVDKSTIQWEPSTLTLRFNMVKGDQAIPVIYNDVPPDTFYEGESAVVEGIYGGDGIFRADTLFVRCPSKYESVIQEAP